MATSAGPSSSRRSSNGTAADSTAVPAANADSDGLDLPHLGQPKAVARRVTEAGVDAVGPLLRLLGEFDASRPELLIGGLAVVGGEKDGSREALGHQGAHLLGGLGIHQRRP